MNEEKKICENEINDIYEAFDCFKERFLNNKKSIFSDNEIFTKNNLNKIIKGFVEKPDESDKSFDEKIRKQLGQEQDTHELFAHVIWLWSLVASDMKEESKKADVNKWLVEDSKIKKDNEFFFNHGIMSTGQYHKTNKPAELVYIIKFLYKVLDSDTKNNYVEIIKDGVDDNAQKEEVTIATSTKKVAMYNILLHLLDPNNFTSIASFSHKEKIVNFFAAHFDIKFSTDDLDEQFKQIWDKCINEFDNKYPYTWNNLYKNKEFNKLDFYHKDLEYLWKSEIILESKNIILHGAPGTGKTYSVENSIKNRLEFLNNQNANKQFKLVQFHPSYSYEDFIDGIKPAGISKDGNMKFELVNGEFKNICIKAASELKNNPKNPKKFYFVADEINRAELSRVFGELLLCLEDDKRLSYKHGKWYGTKVKTQNSTMWKEKHAVVAEDNEYYFGVPENIYFIGTMNDIDRSVDSFDMALRRRFFWKHYRCDYDVIYEKFSSSDKINEYILICKRLNNFISSSNGFNLGNSYELGHSYFMKISNLNNTQINKLWNNNIAPLLKEYLRAEYSENDIQKELDKLKKDFKLI